MLAGFAGATADAFTLFERFEAKLEKHQGNLTRAAIELTKEWRTDRQCCASSKPCWLWPMPPPPLIITGNGDVLGARAGHCLHRLRRCLCALCRQGLLLNNTELSAEDIVRKSLAIAA